MNIIHVINLSQDQVTDPYKPTQTDLIKSHRVQRIFSIVQQSKQFGFAVQFHEGVKGNNLSKTNISQAFKKVILYAKEKNIPQITIAEDDMIFCSKNSWKYYQTEMPKEFDLYLGGIYAGQLFGNRIVNGFSGLTLVTVHSRFYDFMLAADEKIDLDNWLGNHAHKKLYIVTLPFVVKQQPGYSENHGREITSYAVHEEAWQYYSR